MFEVKNFSIGFIVTLRHRNHTHIPEQICAYFCNVIWVAVTSTKSILFLKKKTSGYGLIGSLAVLQNCMPV